MESLVSITNKEWSEVTGQVKENTRQISYHDKKFKKDDDRFDEISERVDHIEKEQISFPMSVQKAVEQGMAPVLEKLLSHEREFTDMKISKEVEAKEKALKEVEDAKERKKWFYRTMVGAAVTAAVAGVVGFYIAVFLNMIAGG